MEGSLGNDMGLTPRICFWTPTVQLQERLPLYCPFEIKDAHKANYTEDSRKENGSNSLIEDSRVTPMKHS